MFILKKLNKIIFLTPNLLPAEQLFFMSQQIIYDTDSDSVSTYVKL